MCDIRSTTCGGMRLSFSILSLPAFCHFILITFRSPRLLFLYFVWCPIYSLPLKPHSSLSLLIRCRVAGAKIVFFLLLVLCHRASAKASVKLMNSEALAKARAGVAERDAPPWFEDRLKSQLIAGLNQSIGGSGGDPYRGANFNHCRIRDVPRLRPYNRVDCCTECVADCDLPIRQSHSQYQRFRCFRRFRLWWRWSGRCVGVGVPGAAGHQNRSNLARCGQCGWVSFAGTGIFGNQDGRARDAATFQSVRSIVADPYPGPLYPRSYYLLDHSSLRVYRNILVGPVPSLCEL